MKPAFPNRKCHDSSVRMRRELKKRRVKKLKVVYSKEEPIKPNDGDYKTPASISFVPSVAGLIIAGEVIKDIING